VPRKQILNERGTKTFMDMLRNVTIIAPDFAPFYCDTFNVAKQQHPDNAILPAWREGFAVCSPAGQWDWKAKPMQMRKKDLFAAKCAATNDECCDTRW
jgi:hypothetical protein